MLVTPTLSNFLPSEMYGDINSISFIKLGASTYVFVISMKPVTKYTMISSAYSNTSWTVNHVTGYRDSKQEYKHVGFNQL